MLDSPLIWTTKGNLPVASLRQEIEWRVSDENVIFIERYWLGDEIVKESSHIRVLIGATADGAASI